MNKVEGHLHFVSELDHKRTLDLLSLDGRPGETEGVAQWTHGTQLSIWCVPQIEGKRHLFWRSCRLLVKFSFWGTVTDLNWRIFVLFCFCYSFLRMGQLFFPASIVFTAFTSVPVGRWLLESGPPTCLICTATIDFMTYLSLLESPFKMICKCYS